MQLFLFLFFFSIFIQLLYYLIFFRRAVFYKNKNISSPIFPQVSVLISAKDEAENLEKFLPKIYAQEYPVFEVVLIDDRSIDNTWEVMESFRKKYPFQTRVVKVDFTDNPRFIGNKKYALTLGIKAAKNNCLLFTDADCIPASKNWIKEMAALFDDKKHLILGVGKYKDYKSFLNKLIRFETAQTALQYVSYALSGIPYMGVGRNLSYTKDLFFSNNGFYNHIDVMSGDDDLFVNEVATKENLAVSLSPKSFTISTPKQSWKEWIYQKRRHISTSSYYKLKHQILLSVYYFSVIVYYFTAFFLLINKYQWKIVLGLVILRSLIVLYFQSKWMKKLKENDLGVYFLLLEPVLILIQLYIFIVNLFSKPKNWTH